MVRKMVIAEAEKFLQKPFVENFLSKNSKLIFAKETKIEVLEIKRFSTLNPTSFNIFYLLRVDGQEIEIRAATSTIWEYDYNFNTIEFLYHNGFAEGNIQVAKPLYFFADRNLMFYQNVIGEQLKAKLGEGRDSLSAKIVLSAKALRKIHHFKNIPYHLWDHDWQFDEDLIGKHCPEVKNSLSSIRGQVIDDLAKSSNRKCLCHGDYQPGNIIVNSEELIIIDWGSTTFSFKELDIASFISQLRVMLSECKREEDFLPLEKIFLDSYGDYDDNLLNYFEFLYNVRIINSIAKSEDLAAKQRIDLACQSLQETFKKIKRE